MSYSQLLSGMMNAILTNDTSAAPALLRDRDGFPPRAQLAVYAEGYRLRLLGALENTYPALFYYMGFAEFVKLARAFIAETPSRMFNLDRYTIGFGPYVAGVSEDAFARELALLESAVHDVCQREETQAMTQEWAAAQTPETLSAAPLGLREAACLLACEYPVDAYVSGFREGQNPSRPEPEKNRLLVLRHRHRVTRLTLEEGEHTLLSLLQSGLTLGAALDDPRMAPYSAESNFAQRLQRWFARFITEGMLRQPS